MLRITVEILGDPSSLNGPSAVLFVFHEQVKIVIRKNMNNIQPW